MALLGWEVLSVSGRPSHALPGALPRGAPGGRLSAEGDGRGVGLSISVKVCPTTGFPISKGPSYMRSILASLYVMMESIIRFSLPALALTRTLSPKHQ